MPTIVTNRALLFRNPNNSQTLAVKPSARPVTLPEWVENDPTYKTHLAAGTLKDVTPAPATEPATPDPDSATVLENAKAQIDAVIETAETAMKTKTPKGK